MPTSCGTLTNEEVLITLAMSSRLPTFVRRKVCFASQVQSTNQMRTLYDPLVRMIFLSPDVSQWVHATLGIPSCICFYFVHSNYLRAMSPLIHGWQQSDDWISTFSNVEGFIYQICHQHSMGGIGLLLKTATVLTCRGITSQHTPKMAHLRGVRKYTGPGWKGSLG